MLSHKRAPNISFLRLPELPTRMKDAACVPLNDELLICGGTENNSCYSYHLSKKQYKFICAYPKEVKLNSHTVLRCDIATNKDSVSGHTATLLSFGGSGDDNFSRHTLLMKYQSVWTNTDVSKHLNYWSSVPKGVRIGRQSANQKDDLQGARAIVGGTKNDLLFITHFPKNIDVFDLKSWTYVPDVNTNILPGPSDFELRYHFVSARSSNQFILLSYQQGLLITYHQSKKEFVFQSFSFEKICHSNPYAYFYHHISFYFENGAAKLSMIVPSFMMSRKELGPQQKKTPFPISHCTPVITSSSTSVHLVGGIHLDGESQRTHFVMEREYILEEIKKVVRKWLRMNIIKRRGWIPDFDFIIAHYLGCQQQNTFYCESFLSVVLGSF